MNSIHKLKEPAAGLIGSFLLALQAVMGLPFLLTMMGSLRHWDTWFHSKNPR